MGKTVNSVKQDLMSKEFLRKYAQNWYIFSLQLSSPFCLHKTKTNTSFRCTVLKQLFLLKIKVILRL